MLFALFQLTLRKNPIPLWDCPGLKPEQILCERFQKSCWNFVGTVTGNDSALPSDGTVPFVVSATVSDQDASRTFQTSNELFRFHKVKEQLSLLDDAKVTIKLQPCKLFSNFFVADVRF